MIALDILMAKLDLACLTLAFTSFCLKQFKAFSVAFPPPVFKERLLEKYPKGSLYETSSGKYTHQRDMETFGLMVIYIQFLL